MSRLPWSKFEWQKWESEPTLRLCSLASQGLWMRLLCMMSQEDGYLLINGKPPSVEAIARVIGHPAEDIRPLLLELQEQGVFTRTRQGVVFCRRMVKGEKRAVAGRMGGLAKARNERDNQDLLLAESEREREEDPQTPKGADVAAVWDITPLQSRKRSSQREIMKALAGAFKRGHSLERVLTGLRGYFTSREATRENGQYMKGVHGLIANDRFLAFTERAPVLALTDADPWPGRLRRWSRSLDWDLMAWGPPPDAPGCKAPPDQVAAALEEYAHLKAERDAQRQAGS